MVELEVMEALKGVAEQLQLLNENVLRAAVALEKGLEVVEVNGSGDTDIAFDAPNYIQPSVVEVCRDACPAAPSVTCAEDYGHKGVHRSRVPNWSWANTEVGGGQANDPRGE